MATTFTAAVAGAKLYYRRNPEMYAKMSVLLDELKREFGWKSRLMAAIGGRYMLGMIRREERRLAAGWTYEPPTYYEKNEACADRDGAAPCRYVTPQAVAPTAATRLPVDLHNLVQV